MESQYTETTLDTVGNGVAKELFARELTAVMENINDTNTPWKAPRKITLEISFAPDEDRKECTVSVSCKAKLAPVKPYSAHTYLVRKGGRTVGMEHTLKQAELDVSNVVPMEGAKDA